MTNKIKFFRNQKGQSLLELLVAILILVTALVTAINLIVTSINAGRESKNKIIATNLAREGIEIVRNIRDSHWVAPVVLSPGWDDGLVSGNDNTATPVVLGGENNIILNFIDNDFTVIKLDAGNNYLQGSSAGGTNTLYYRLLYINPICQDGSGNEEIANKTESAVCGQVGSSVQAFPNKVGIRVISEVRWPSASSSKKVVVEDRLYNWQAL